MRLACDAPFLEDWLTMTMWSIPSNERGREYAESTVNFVAGLVIGAWVMDRDVEPALFADAFSLRDGKGDVRVDALRPCGARHGECNQPEKRRPHGASNPRGAKPWARSFPKSTT